MLDPDVTDQMKSIYSYITNNLLNEPASHSLRDVIKSKLSSISTFPNSGTFLSKVVDDISEIFSSVQKRTAKNYVLLYKYFEKVDVVLITHIFHQTQDYIKIFQK